MVFPVTIEFSKIEAESLAHRLDFMWSCGDLEEIFDDNEEIDFDEIIAYTEALAKQFSQGHYIAVLSCPTHVEALAEAIEGATVQDVARDEADNELISPQKARSVRRSLETAAAKILKTTGREVEIPR